MSELPQTNRNALKKLIERGQISLLAKYGYTEKMCLELCKQYDLLSPIYKYSKRGGCWFCPKSSCEEFAKLKTKHQKLWNELEKLSHTKNLVYYGFQYSKTFQEVESEVEMIISEWEAEKNQLKLF